MYCEPSGSRGEEVLKAIGAILAFLVSIPVIFLLVILFYPRPMDETPAWVFEGDASGIDYCDLPILDGSGQWAADIPQGHTPGCGWKKFPQPTLKYCREPLSEGARDLRGLWQHVDGGPMGHLERIEQCGNRVVVTSSGVIHDLTTDGKLAGASDDVRPVSIGPFEFCIRTSATTKWREGRLEFYALGGPHVVSRYLDGDELVWEYPGIGTTRMKRICKLPPDSRHSAAASSIRPALLVSE
jgi:hypothetical protein